MNFGAHQQNLFGGSGADQRVRGLKSEEEAGALLAKIQCGNAPLQAELVSQQAAASRKIIVRRHGGKDDVVDVIFLQPRVGDGFLRSANA